MIKQSIDQDLKAAMLSGDKQLVNALRTLKGALLDAEISAGARDTGLDESVVITLLQKEAKKRNDAAVMYEQGGNTESAAEEKYEIEVIQKYLPKQLEESEINVLIDEALAAHDGEANMQAMGKIISAVKEKAGGAADGATLAQLVKARLN